MPISEGSDFGGVGAEGRSCVALRGIVGSYTRNSDPTGEFPESERVGLHANGVDDMGATVGDGHRMRRFEPSATELVHVVRRKELHNVESLSLLRSNRLKLRVRP